MVVCRCVFREQDSPGSGGGCGCAVCPTPVSVDCPGILDDWGTGEWTCSVHVKRLYNTLRANWEQRNITAMCSGPHLQQC